jgi:ParB family chromosome partitioning protein
LGRGLDALFNSASVAAAEMIERHSGTSTVAISKIHANPFQPRKSFDEDELQQLTDSIKNHGVLTPLLVRAVGDHFELVAGERRLRAAQRAGLIEVPVFVREMDEQELIEAALVENIQRTDLNPIEKAQGFRDYLEKYHVTQDVLAQRLGMDRSSISNLVNLLNLPAQVQDMVRVGQLSLGHAKLLKGLSDSDQQISLAKETIAKALSVHALESLIKQQRMGETTPETREKSKPYARTAHVQGLEDELRQKLATRVEIKVRSKDKGQIVLTFDSNDDFERLLEVLRK